MRVGKLTFRAHAIRRMFERQISSEDVRNVLETGEKIENYPDDKPYPSFLMFGRVRNRPLHVVAAHNATDVEIITITVYEPDPTQWENGFKTRKAQS